MKIAFISNYHNHHQKFLSEQLHRITNGKYTFIETSSISRERIKLGWGNDVIPSYVKKNFIDDEAYSMCQDIIDNVDTAIIGSAPYRLIKGRLNRRKLTFCYSERIYKQGFDYIKYPKILFNMFMKYTRHKNLYMLCASAFTAVDYAKTATFLGKTYKWGYFPECKYYDDIDKLIRNKNHSEILWCGRMMQLKHPDDVLRVAKKLKNDGYSFKIRMIGIGEMEDSLKQYVVENEIEDNIEFLGSMSPEEVRSHMEKAGIYLFTSDKREGWGAVLNESMNSGCAVVASHSIGSVPFLVKNKENALVYESGNVEMLYQKVKFLLNNPKIQRSLGKKAYLTIAEEWNSEEAANRLVNLARHIIEGEYAPDIYESGPCSKAEIIRENWFYEENTIN